MKFRLAAFFAVLFLVVSACSSADSGTAQTTSDAGTSDTQASATTETPAETSASTVAPDDTSPTETTPAATGGGTAVLSLDTGESFTFSVLCALETQIAADQEILFVVASYDTPYNLDVTQFGADSFGGAANISLYDSATYDTVWEANSLYGGEIELEKDGNTVTGHGVFHPGGDPSNEGVTGDFVANC